jgi:hypothetical protein
LEHNDSGEVASSLERVRPGASAYWESQGLLQMDAGKYDDAWRMLMKSLEIQPDSATTAKLIRQLEAQHSDQVATARIEWLHRGGPALASALRGQRNEQPAESLNQLSNEQAQESQVAVAAPSVLQPQPTDVFEKKIETDEEHRASKSLAVTGAVASPPPVAIAAADPEKRSRRTVMPAPSDTDKPVTKAAFPEKRGERALTRAEPQTAARVRPVRPKLRESVNKMEPPPIAEQPLDDFRKPSRPAISTAMGDFLAIQTLSLKDRSYPRSMAMMDGVEVRLNDTDADLTADFNLYAGKSRVKKIRDMRIGRSQIFAGVSGNLYRLTLLGIHHKSRTVRVGIKPE